SHSPRKHSGYSLCSFFVIYHVRASVLLQTKKGLDIYLSESFVLISPHIIRSPELPLIWVIPSSASLVPIREVPSPAVKDLPFSVSKEVSSAITFVSTSPCLSASIFFKSLT